jgi:hypothetical protein
MKTYAAPLAPLLLLALALTTAFAPLGQEGEPQQAATNWRVTVTITRAETPRRPGSSEWVWSVDPYRIVIAEGDSVTWVVEWAACDAAERPSIIGIHPKPKVDPPPWPFHNHPHVGIDTVVADSMIPEPQGQYKYKIHVVCPGLGGQPVDIDPDMDVLD